MCNTRTVEKSTTKKDSLFLFSLGLTLSSGGDPLSMGYRLKIDTSVGMKTFVEDRWNEPRRLHLRVPFADSDRESRTENKGVSGGRGKNRGACTKRTIKTAEVPRRPKFKKATWHHVSPPSVRHTSRSFSLPSRGRDEMSRCFFLHPAACPSFRSVSLLPSFSPRGRNLGAFWLIESSPRASTSFPFAAEDKRMGEHPGGW